MAFINIMDIVYPVGSVYFGATSTSTATLFGGTWTQIKDTLIGASGDTYGAVGNNGGDTKIRDYNLPEHIHNCVSANNVDDILNNNDAGWAGFWFSNTSSGSNWSIGTYGTSSQSAEKWLYAAKLTGVSGVNKDYIPYHYNMTVWKRTA